MSASFDLFWKREEEKKDWRKGEGGWGGAASVLLIFFFSYEEKVNYLIHGGGGLVAINGMALELCKGGNRLSFLDRKPVRLVHRL